MTLLIGVGAWYRGSLLLRVAAFWCFVGAGLLLLVSRPGDVSRWARPALFGCDVACGALRSACHQAPRRGRCQLADGDLAYQGNSGVAVTLKVSELGACASWPL